MARKVEVRLTDDLDDSPADETVSFGLDGINYEIDLSVKHAKELRAALDKFVQGARRAGRGPAKAARSRARSGGARPDGLQNQAIRAWAQRKGLAVADRGRIPQSIVEQYQSEAGKAPATGKRGKG